MSLLCLRETLTGRPLSQPRNLRGHDENMTAEAQWRTCWSGYKTLADPSKYNVFEYVQKQNKMYDMKIIPLLVSLTSLVRLSIFSLDFSTCLNISSHIYHHTLENKYYYHFNYVHSGQHIRSPRGRWPPEADGKHGFQFHRLSVKQQQKLMLSNKRG